MLLERPAFSRSTSEILAWVGEGILLAYTGLLLSQSGNLPIVIDPPPNIGGGTGTSNSSAPGIPLGDTNVALEKLVEISNTTVYLAMHYKDNVKSYLDKRSLNRPKLPQVLKISLRVLVYLAVFKGLTMVWEDRERLLGAAGKSDSVITLRKTHTGSFRTTYSFISFVNAFASGNALIFEVKDAFVVAEMGYFFVMLADYALQNTQDFVDYRFISPTKAIIDDLFLNKRNRLTDPGAIEDAKESLRKVSVYDLCFTLHEGRKEKLK